MERLHAAADAEEAVAAWRECMRAIVDHKDLDRMAAMCLRREGSVWMTENISIWPSGHRKTEKTGGRLAAEKALSPEQWHKGMISANLEVIRETPVEKHAGRPCL